MLGVFFILLATALIYVFIAGTFVAGGKAVYDVAKKQQQKSEDYNQKRTEKMINEKTLALDPKYIKELQNQGKQLSEQQKTVLMLELQAKESHTVQFDEYAYNMPSNQCVPVIDSVEKLHELRKEKEQAASGI